MELLTTGRRIVRLVLRRSLWGIALVVAVSAGVFALAAVSPFDPLVSYLGARYQATTPAQLESLRAALGLDGGWWSGWTGWWADLARGDAGFSRSHAQPVAEVVAERLPWTLLLSGAGFVVALVVGAVTGIWSGLRPGSWLDHLISGVAVVVQAVPPFVLAMATIVIFSVGLGWLPGGGAAPVAGQATAGTVALHLVAPALALGLGQAPWLALSLRESVVGALGSDPVRGALVRGVPWPRVVRAHVLPVSFAPFVALLGARLPELVVGAVLVEEVFAWPGIAAATVEAARSLDMALLAALACLTTAVVLVGSLLADIAYLLLDPRVEIDA